MFWSRTFSGVSGSDSSRAHDYSEPRYFLIAKAQGNCHSILVSLYGPRWQDCGNLEKDGSAVLYRD
jgi:hypothetical protein